ncbi:MAG: hypothetical protein E7497_04635 [Ruminococcus sp.]|nr:hypothetical protein [Ruminococcus sp.]
MIKGVNKRIIEINNPDSIYFEKAVFYLKSGVRELPVPVAREEAERILSRYCPEIYDAVKRKNPGRIFMIIISIAALIGITASFLL